jgi:hypothetical protein
VGWIASRISTASAPLTPRSSAVTGSPLRLSATTMLPSRSRMSSSPVASASTAMISLATAMSKPVSRSWPFSASPCPTVMRRRWRSHVSSTRCQVMVEGSMSRRTKRERCSGVSSSGVFAAKPSFAARRACTGEKTRPSPFLEGNRRSNITASSGVFFSCIMRVSSAAAHRLLAAVMAWMSPVRCRLKSSMGITCA